MNPTPEQIATQALSLPMPDRARLAEALLSSLDAEPDVEAAWMTEVARRFATRGVRPSGSPPSVSWTRHERGFGNSAVECYIPLAGKPRRRGRGGFLREAKARAWESVPERP